MSHFDDCITALEFAARKHKGQMLRGKSLPYFVHIVSVASEISFASANGSSIDLPFALKLAYLHDTIEDTETSYDDIHAMFGKPTADGVLALTKLPEVPKRQQIMDSVQRIKTQPKEVWMVKLADRISNLTPPPRKWSKEKIFRYHSTSQLILNELGSADEWLSGRLREKIANYQIYLPGE
jgi:guanosine-3',5'-bis(diphosphate) 3'-pyrophosphohydrolase